MSGPVDKFQLALNDYETALEALAAKKPGAIGDYQILTVLRARDSVEKLWQISENSAEQLSFISTEQLLHLSHLDSQLKEYQAGIAQYPQLEHWKQSFHPPESAWWWRFSPPVDARNRLDWLWTGLTVAALTTNVALVVDLVPRFLAGSPGFVSSLAALSPAVLTLIASGGALTKAGRQTIETLLKKLNLSKSRWHETKFALSVIVLIGLLGIHSQLPHIARRYTHHGKRLYRTEQKIASAQDQFERALRLQPDLPEAQFMLGVIFEDFRQLETAKIEYLKAAKAGYLEAYNNLARLHLLEESYEDAIPLLEEAKREISNNEQAFLGNEDSRELYYSVLKNMGWARLQQGNLDKAEDALAHAIDVNPEGVEAYCLMAQVLEKRGEIANARAYWQKVMKTATHYVGDTCRLQAQRKLEGRSPAALSP